MEDKISVIIANTSELREGLFDIRKKVFVEEQKVDAKQEYDQYDTSSSHLIALLDSTPVGTCRFRNTEYGIKLERFAVLNEYRGQGIGSELVHKVLNVCDIKQRIYLHAQIQVVAFYQQFGFVQEGPLFVEAGIKHYKMVLDTK